MKTQLRILVIEDRPKHCEDAVIVLRKLQSSVCFQMDITFVQSMAEVCQQLRDADAVISDVFFPAVPGGSEEPNGMKVAQQCLEDGRPFVLITSSYHHDKLTEPVNRWIRKHHMRLFDVNSSVGYEAVDYSQYKSFGDAYQEEERRKAARLDTVTKPWHDAFLGLMYLVIGVEIGVLHLTTSGLVDCRDEGTTHLPGMIKCIMSNADVDRNDARQYLQEDIVLQALVSAGLLVVRD